MLDHTYNQTLQWRSTSKVIGIVAGQGLVELPTDDSKAWKKVQGPGQDAELEEDQEAQMEKR